MRKKIGVYTYKKKIRPHSKPKIINNPYFQKVPYSCHMMFRHPFTMMISGPTQSGKSTLISNLLKFRNQMFKYTDECGNDRKLQFKKIHWHHDSSQPLHKELQRTIKNPQIKFIEGLPDEDELRANRVPMLLIIDDLMKETNSSQVVGNIFTKISHHNNISVIYLLQNLFANQGKSQSRDISLNAQYIILMKNPRDSLQPKILGTQMTKSQFLSSAYGDSTKQSYGYLLLDFTQRANDLLRFRTNIFPDDKVKHIYLPHEKTI